jgi:galactonate dehydratase
VGKAAKAPIFRLLGGPTRNKARALVHLTGTTTAEKAASLARAAAAGYRAFSVSLPSPAARNQGQAYQRDVRKMMEELRSGNGQSLDFVLDAGASLTPGDAASVATTVERLHPLWFDEPCAISNPQTIRKIADESVVPLGFGREILDPGIYQSLLREGLIDVLRPDVARGGITAIRRLAALAEPYYTAVAPRHGGGPIGTAAALHLAACLPNFFIQSIPMPDAREDIEMRAALVGRALERVQDGFAALPAGPGLGIQVSEAALEKYHAA